MKKTIVLILLLIPILCFAGALQEKQRAVIVKKNVAPTSCSGNCSDNFTGTQTALATHDAKWGSFGGKDDIAQGEINGSGLARVVENYADVWARYTDSTADTSQMTIKAGGDTQYRAFKVCVRTSASIEGYCLTCAANTADNNSTWDQSVCDIKKNGTTLCSGFAEKSISYASSDVVVKLVASGTETVTLKAYVDGSEWSTSPACTDASSPITSGNPGIFWQSGTSYTTNTVDDWQDH